MHIQNLEILNFKNYENQKVHFLQKVNLIYGANGSGKTNLLDAIYYLCISKSYFSLSDREVLRDGADGFRLAASIKMGDDTTDEVFMKYKAGQKKEIFRNKVKHQSAADLIGLYPVVFISPDDIRIVKDDSRHRRSLVDRMLSQSDQNYLAWLMEYNRALKQKNAHLKQAANPDPIVLEGINLILKKNSQRIFDRRSRFIEEFAPDVQSRYTDLSDGREHVSMTYESQFKSRDISRYDTILSDEIRARKVLLGIHKDDFGFFIDQKLLKRFGSQGQIKSFLYALRLTELDFLYAKTGRMPILLLDDLFEKLDNKRLENLLLQLRSDTFDQVFLSDTELNRSQDILRHNGIPFAAYEVVKGAVTESKMD